MPEAATTTVIDAAYAVLDAAPALAGRGSKERAHPWQAEDLPRWALEWESARVTGYLGGAYDCEMTMAFSAWAEGEGANAVIDGLWLAAQTALAASGKLSNLVRDLRLVEASRELDDAGRAITGTVRVLFRVEYDTDISGVIEAR